VAVDGTENEDDDEDEYGWGTCTRGERLPEGVRVTPSLLDMDGEEDEKDDEDEDEDVDDGVIAVVDGEDEGEAERPFVGEAKLSDDVEVAAWFERVESAA